MNLTVAIIGKNEENNINRLLNSIKSGIQHLVYVDTGSTDKTLEVVEQYKSIINISIHKFKWINDFSAARNYSFDKAKGSYDWLLWLDCDDEFSDIMRLRQELENLPKECNCIMLPYYYYFDEFGKPILTLPRERIFHSSINPVWTGKIHESIPIGEFKTAYINIPVYHRRTPQDMQQDINRNVNIFKECIDINNSREIYYYAKELQHSGQILDSKKYFRQRIEMGGFIDEIFSSHISLAEIYLGQKEYDHSIEHCNKAIQIYDDIADPYYIMGMCYKELGKVKAAIYFFESCLNIGVSNLPFCTPIGGILGRVTKYVYKPEHTKYQLGIYYPRSYIEPLRELEYLYFQIQDYNSCYMTINKIREYYKNTKVSIDMDYVTLSCLLFYNIPQNNEDRVNNNLKLNLGSGTQNITGFMNIDKYDTHADIINDIKGLELEPFCCSDIRAYHYIEHLDTLEYNDFKYYVSKYIKPGGLLEITCPDFDVCCEKYLENKNIYSWPFTYRDWYKKTIYGRQISDGKIDFGQFHKSGHSASELNTELESSGFIMLSDEQYNDNDTPSIRVKAIKGIVCYAEYNNDLDNVTNRIRGYIPFQLINNGKNGQKTNNISAVVKFNLATFENDINSIIYPNVVIIRSFGAEIIQLIEKYKTHGRIKWIYDYNEDIGSFTSIYDTLSKVDLVVCCSTLLAQKIKDVNSNVVVIPDMVEDRVADETCKNITN